MKLIRNNIYYVKYINCYEKGDENYQKAQAMEKHLLILHKRYYQAKRLFSSILSETEYKLRLLDEE